MLAAATDGYTRDRYINVPLDYAENPVLLEILDSEQLIPLVQSIMVDDDDDEHFVTTGLPGGRVVSLLHRIATT